ncbi:MAG: trigger factor [Phycisphaeraceae bacterium]|nr:trigger factor [Phycisphaeraceae bacterium]MDP7347093.1 trigger factor [Phycisphaeraceae bacterium]
MADEDGMYPDPEESGERAEQTVTLEDIGPARKCLTIEIPETRITAKLAEQYKQLRDDAAIPGFRRGRAPKRLIEKRFGQAVRDDARGQLISESYTQAIEEEKLEVLGEPDVKDIDDIELPDAGEMTFKVEVEVAPDVELPDLSKLKVEKAERQATDDDVQEEIDNLSRRHGKPVQVDEAIAAQDMLVAQVKILAGDDPAHDAEPLNFLPDAHITVNGESADFRGHAAGILIDDLGKRLIGKNRGHIETIAMTGPSSHESDQIRDKPITIEIQVEKVERIEPAPVEELARDFGFASDPELRDLLKDMLNKRFEREQTAAMHEQISDQLRDMVDMTLPPGLSERQTSRLLQREAMNLAYQGNTEEQIEQKIAEMRNSSEEEAARQLKLHFILSAAAEKLDVEVHEGEVNSRIAMIATEQGRRPEKLRQEMQRSGRLESVYLQIREQKTLDAIIEQATPTQTPAADSKEPVTDKKKKKNTKKKSSAKPAAATTADDADDGLASGED